MSESFVHNYFDGKGEMITTSFSIFDKLSLFKKELRNRFGLDTAVVGVLPITVYLYSVDESKLENLYTNLFQPTNVVIVFAIPDSKNVTFKIKLGEELFIKSRFTKKEEVKQVSVVVCKKDLIETTISAKSILKLFGDKLDGLFQHIYLEDKKASYPIFSEFRGEVNRKMPQPIKNKLNFTIGIFFDGTGNNRYNTELINDLILNRGGISDYEKAKKHLSKEKTIPHPKNKNPVEVKDWMFEVDSSYINAYSNIVLLHDLYNKKSEQDSEIIKIYIQGIGTKTELNKNGEVVEYLKDDISGSAFGVGDWGVSGRMKSAFDEVIKKVSQKIQEKGMDFGTITFDLFGFSRGASVARLFAMEIQKIHNPKPVPFGMQEQDDDFELTVGYFGKLLKEKLNLEISKTNWKDLIQARVIGLFDTVLESVLLKTNSISLENCEANVCHIIAYDECRHNFPLTPSKAKNNFNLYLYGVHADMGGSYNSIKSTTTLAYESFLNDIETEEKYSRDRLIYLKRKFEHKYVIEIGINKLYSKISLKEQIRKHPIVTRSGTILIDKKVLSLIDERAIKKNLSFVALVSMIQYCKNLNLDIPFAISKDKINILDFSEVENNKPYFSFPEDDKLFVQYLKEVSFLTASRKTEKRFVDKDVFYKIYFGYVHISNHYDNPKYGIYIHKPNKNFKREITAYQEFVSDLYQKD